jgi:hypothetical protein
MRCDADIFCPSGGAAGGRLSVRPETIVANALWFFICALTRNHGYTGSYSAVYRFLHQLVVDVAPEGCCRIGRTGGQISIGPQARRATVPDRTSRPPFPGRSAAALLRLSFFLWLVPVLNQRASSSACASTIPTPASPACENSSFPQGAGSSAGKPRTSRMQARMTSIGKRIPLKLSMSIHPFFGGRILPLEAPIRSPDS